MRREKERIASMQVENKTKGAKQAIFLRGHLFDYNVINQVS